MKSTKSLPSITAIASLTWRRVQPRYWKIVAVLVGAACLQIPLNYLTLRLPEYERIVAAAGSTATPDFWTNFTPTFLVLALAGTILQTWGRVWARSLIIDDKANISKTFQFGTKMLIPFLWMSFLGLIASLPAFMVFVIPGFVFYIFVWFADWALLEKKVNAFDALATSRELVRGRFWAVLWRVSVPFVLFNLSAVIVSRLLGSSEPSQTLSVQSIILSLFIVAIAPFIFSYDFELYSQLKKTAGELKIVPRTIRKFKILAVLGLLFIVGSIWLTIWSTEFVQKLQIQQQESEQSFGGPIS